MPLESIRIEQPSGGVCPASVVTPQGIGPWPAVIFYADAGGMRPAMIDMAQRLSSAGYLVLVPDLYWRHGPYEALVPSEVFQGDVAAILGPLMATTGTDKAADDTASFLAYLDARADVGGESFAAIGFCMGGGLALAAASSYPERFAAIASFHGGNLATDAPTSPHLLVRNLLAQTYIASADQDPSYPPDTAARLEAALAESAASVDAETYEGAMHGWMVPNFPVHDPVAAARGWAAAIALFDSTLKPSA